MKLFLSCFCSLVWAGVSWLADRWLHDFWIAFTLGGLAALIVVCGISALRSAAMADQLERNELRHIAEKMEGDL